MTYIRLMLTTMIVAMMSCNTKTVVKTDVLVIGGGTSGISAGLQSARLGVHTMVVEEGNWLGGMITAAGVSAFDGNHRLPSGLWKEFRDLIYSHYGGPEKVETGWVSNTLFEPHVGDSIFKSMASKEKMLTVHHGFRFVSVIRQGKKIQGAVFEELVTGKEMKVEAKVVIDATELGDVLADAQIPFDLGMEAGDVADEDVGVEQSNDIVQDLTWVAVLKDYGSDADCTIVRPAQYDPREFDGACKDYYLDTNRVAPGVDAVTMLNYGRLPRNKYMINWPNYGNDFYVNVVNMTPAQRDSALVQAKQQTLRFVYFIQHQLGFKNLGLADDEFDTKDRLAIMPYHREARRVKGLVRYNMRYLAEPFSYKHPLYKTGIAVGDYPVDHHHKKNPGAPQHLDFYPIPSFNVPLGAMLPQVADGIIVAEKSIGVSNVINGATRLQPCVLLIGQAAGALAALSVEMQVQPRQVPVRKLQAALLDASAMLMPYIDATPGMPHFTSTHRIGATGILKGKGVSFKWANQTWFYPEGPVVKKTLKLDAAGILADLTDEKGNLTVEQAYELIRRSALSVKGDDVRQLPVSDVAAFSSELKKIWDELHLTRFDPLREITRAEFAVLLDKTIDPFSQLDIDHYGNLKIK